MQSSDITSLNRSTGSRLEHRSPRSLVWLGWAAGGVAAVAALYGVSRYSYLLFHGVAELFSIAVAWSVFMLVWNARDYIEDQALTLLGTAYLFIGFLDILHTLAYKGMGVFPALDAPNMATQFWITGRILEGVSLLLFALMAGRRVNLLVSFWTYFFITALLTLFILVWHVFPVCYVEGVGLSAFKKGTEYAICFILTGALALLYHKRHRFDPTVLRLVSASICVTIAGELCFTLYVDVSGFFNMLGHLFKITSYLLIYLALIQSGLKRPYDVLYRDLAEQKEVLRKSEEKYRLIAENATDTIWVMRLDGTFLYHSPSVQQLHGYTPEEAKRISLAQMVTPESMGLLRRIIEEEEKKPPTDQWADRILELEAYRKDGSVIWTEVSLRAVRDAEGRVQALQGSTRDITERKRIEARLAAEHATLEAIFNASPEILVLKDNDLIYRRVNPAFSAFMGRTREEIVGRTDYDLFPAADAEKYVSGDRAVIQTGIPEDRERLVMGHKGGRWLQVIKTAVHDAAGRSLGVLCTGRDVTERRRLENLLVDSREKEQRRLGQELHDGLCQDLKSLEIELALIEDRLTEKNPLEASELASVESRLNAAVQKAYSMAKGMLPLGLETKSLDIAIEELALSARARTTARIVTKIAPELRPDNPIAAYHIFRIAQEALNNAVRHSGASLIEIQWTHAPPNSHLVIRDNGCGISKMKDPGPGMGLMVMRSRAYALQAEFEIMNRPEGGTEIRCTCPLAGGRGECDENSDRR